MQTFSIFPTLHDYRTPSYTFVGTYGLPFTKIEDYIRNQIMDDQAEDQLSLKEFIDPFTGEPVVKGK